MSNEKPEEQPAITFEIAMAQVSQLYVENEEFRTVFDADPRETLGKLAGSPLPDDTNVVVHHRQPKEIHIVLPDADVLAAEASGVVSDDLLDKVNAGYGVIYFNPALFGLQWPP